MIKQIQDDICRRNLQSQRHIEQLEQNFNKWEKMKIQEKEVKLLRQQKLKATIDVIHSFYPSL